MGIDSYYTSSELADELIDYHNTSTPIKIYDPCLGDGELLRAALRKWTKLKLFGSDISFEAINNTNKTHKDWNLKVYDFLNDNEVDNHLKEIGTMDMVLINPPFTCKGSTIRKVKVDGKEFTCSIAMNFIANSLKFLNKNGMMYCILPVSCCFSKKDLNIWSYLKDYRAGKILNIPNSRKLFKGCDTNVILVSIKGKIEHITKIDLTKSDNDLINIKVHSIFRGNLSVNDSIKYESEEGYYFLHTTNLINNKLDNLNKKCLKKGSIITGPAILFPRVGSPSIKKIVKIKANETYIISDCIIGLKVNINSLNSVYKEILSNWEIVKATYIGTGAKYTTIERLEKIFPLREILKSTIIYREKIFDNDKIKTLPKSFPLSLQNNKTS